MFREIKNDLRKYKISHQIKKQNIVKISIIPNTQCNTNENTIKMDTFTLRYMDV